MTLLLLYLFLAIGVSFICSILEAVLLSITPAYVEEMLINKPKIGQQISYIRNNLDQSISSILILNTFAHTVGAVGVGAQAIALFGKEWETIIAIVLTLTILYFSEIIPKTLGALFWSKLAPFACIIITWLIKLVYPLVWISSCITNTFGNHHTTEVTREQLIALSNVGRKEGTLRATETQYLENVLRLRELSTVQICTPRSVVHMLDQSTTVTDALNHKNTQTFTRIPVFNQNSDTIVGKVVIRDLYNAQVHGQGNATLESIIRPIGRVSEKLPVTQLLDRFIKEKIHMFLVEDEFGQTTGIVTLEDALETLLGEEIMDEYDTVENMQELAKVMYKEKLRQRKPKVK